MTETPQFKDQFDLARIKLSTDYEGLESVKKLITVVPVKKPNAQEFVRVHPSPEMRLQTTTLILKDEGETYLVEKDLWPELLAETAPVCLYTAINRQGVLFLWCVKMPIKTNKQNWTKSTLDAIGAAQKGWIRMQANMSGGYYDIYKASGNLPEPEWPELTFQEIIRIAFRDRFIDSLDHPALKQLRGEV